MATDAIDVEADTARCDGCGEVLRFSDIPKRLAMRAALEGQRPRGVWERETEGGWIVGGSIRNTKVAMVVWTLTVFWNGFVWFSIWDNLRGAIWPQNPADPIGRASSVVFVVILIPFALIGVALIGIGLIAALGREQVAVSHGRGTLFAGVWRFGFRRAFDAGAVTDVRITPGGGMSNGKPIDHVLLEFGTEAPIGVGSMVGERRRAWFGATLRERLVRARR